MRRLKRAVARYWMKLAGAKWGPRARIHWREYLEKKRQQKILRRKG